MKKIRTTHESKILALGICLADTHTHFLPGWLNDQLPRSTWIAPGNAYSWPLEPYGPRLPKTLVLVITDAQYKQPFVHPVHPVLLHLLLAPLVL
jgi:hypothetical protein